MARKHYPNLSTATEVGFTPTWPCTLMIYAGAAGGFSAPDINGQPSYGYGKIAIEVRKENGQYQRFSDLEFSEETVTPLDLPGSTIRVVAERMTNVTVEIVDSGA